MDTASRALDEWMALRCQSGDPVADALQDVWTPPPSIGRWTNWTCGTANPRAALPGGFLVAGGNLTGTSKEGRALPVGAVVNQRTGGCP